jgi:hypothetical protein
MYGLQFSNIYGRVQDYANIKNIVGSDTKAKAAVNDALRKLAAERRWEILRRTGTITPVASTQTYSIAGLTGFNYPVEVYYISNGIRIPIKIVSESEWSANVDSQSTGTPSICIFSARDGTEKLYLSTMPSSAFVSLYGTIYVDFDKKPTELVADADIPEIPNTNSQMALVYYAVAELCAQQGDANGVSVWEQKGMKELTKFFNNDINFKGKQKPIRPMFGILDGVYSNNRSDDYK